MTIDEPTERGLPRAYLRVVLLTLVAAGPAHGYELLEQVRQAGIRLADPGALYRTLRAMDQQQLLESWWENSSAGPPRRTYVMTPRGRAVLDEEVHAIRATVDLLAEVVGRAERVLDQQTQTR